MLWTTLVSVIVLLILAGFLIASRSTASGSGPADPSRPPAEPEDLFINVDPETQRLLLDDWRWKVGKDAVVFRVSIFGDIFTKVPGGRIYRLDTGWGSYVEVARNAEQLAQETWAHGREWFHLDTFRDLCALGVELEEGHVYSWRHPPMLGGTEAIDNVDFMPITVHVSASGQIAKALEDISPEEKIEESDSEILDSRGTQKAVAGGDEETSSMTDEEFDAFLETANSELRRKQEMLNRKYSIGSFLRFQFDQDTAKLRFFDRDDRLALEADVIDIGSYSSKSNSWMWAWSNESVAPQLRQKAEKLQELKNITGLALFATATAFKVKNDLMAWDLAAMAVKHLEALGCYRAPAPRDGPVTFLAITGLTMLSDPP